MYQWKYVLLGQEVKPLLTKPLLWQLLLLQIFFWHIVKKNIMQETTWWNKFTKCESSSCLLHIVYKWLTKSEADKNIPFSNNWLSKSSMYKKKLTILFRSRKNSTSCETLHHYLPFSILQTKSTFPTRYNIACMFKQSNRPSSQLHIHVQLQWNHQHSFVHTYHSHACIPFFNFLSSTIISTISSILCNVLTNLKWT